MNHRYPLAALFASLGSVAHAETDTFTDMVVQDLLANGFTHVEIEHNDRELWAEGRGKKGSIALVYNRETGAIMSKEYRYDEGENESEDFVDIDVTIRGDDEAWDDDDQDDDEDGNDDDREDRDDDDEDGDDE